MTQVRGPRLRTRVDWPRVLLDVYMMPYVSYEQIGPGQTLDLFLHKLHHPNSTMRVEIRQVLTCI